MEKKVVLITGTSTGLGLKTSIAFGIKGYRVYATMRNLEKKIELEKEASSQSADIVIMQLDVSDPISIKNCVAAIEEKEGKIDILINNAGAGFLRASEQISEEELIRVTDVNYLGVVRCTNAVLPIMRKRKCGHIINISSVGGLVGQPFNELYCAAKFAVEGYTEAMATYITPFFRIKFTIIEPGGITTEFAKSVYKTVKSDSHQDNAYEEIFNQYMAVMQGRPKEFLEQMYQSGDEVAQKIIECIEMKDPPLRTRTSQWSNEFCKLKTEADPDGLKLHQSLMGLYWNK
jgi:NAD(P)-dependent dehydrogenase (short-subunit alcohol dehydrogenase family)